MFSMQSRNGLARFKSWRRLKMFQIWVEGGEFGLKTTNIAPLSFDDMNLDLKNTESVELRVCRRVLRKEPKSPPKTKKNVCMGA